MKNQNLCWPSVAAPEYFGTLYFSKLFQNVSIYILKNVHIPPWKGSASTASNFAQLNEWKLHLYSAQILHYIHGRSKTLTSQKTLIKSGLKQMCFKA